MNSQDYTVKEEKDEDEAMNQIYAAGIDELISMGFAKTNSIEALTAALQIHDGVVEHAIDDL
eukprot:3777533-Ditylum_brightwellii.AAC.1